MFGLTVQERKAVVFLFVIALSGGVFGFAAARLPASRAVLAVPDDLARVDVNSARKELLMRVPGVGKGLAKKIISYRDSRSGLTSLEQLRNIDSITEARFEKIKDYLVVR